MTCTSRPQVWGVGTQQRKPGKARDTDYHSRSSIKKKSHRDPRAHRHHNRITPEQKRNFLISRLQSSGKPTTEWETLMDLHYEDFAITPEYCQFIGEKCCQFLRHIQESTLERDAPCFQLSESQSGDEDWDQYRCWMITASRAKEVLGLTSSFAKCNYLRRNLWQVGSRVVSAGMEYGIESEPIAKIFYLIEVRKENPAATVMETGLWALRDFPQLGCSPDGIVKDGDEVRLLEIKCPITLSDHDPNRFEVVLNKGQLPNFCLKNDADGSPFLKTNHPYYFQIQMSLGILSINVCDLFVWSRHGFILLPIKFDAAHWETMKKKLVEIHATLILPEYFAMRTVRGLKPMILPKQYLPFLYEGRIDDSDQGGGSL